MGSVLLSEKMFDAVQIFRRFEVAWGDKKCTTLLLLMSEFNNGGSLFGYTKVSN